jgi:hypothetical protein
MVITNWGPCDEPPSPCPGDANGNGEVEVQDLVLVITNWGNTCALQEAPDNFWTCIDRCGPTNPSCIVSCGEMFGLFD